MTQSATDKAYWHLLTEVSKYMSNDTKVKFTKNELHELFKYLFDIESIKGLTKDQWGEYLTDILTVCLTTFNVPPRIVLPTDPGGIQWTNFNDDKNE